MNDGFLNMLGLCKRAGRLSAGHDSSFDAISKNKASLCFLAKDASDRLKNEFEKTARFEQRTVPLVLLPYTMEEIQSAIGRKTAVMTINDDSFARRLMELLDTQHGEDDV